MARQRGRKSVAAVTAPAASGALVGAAPRPDAPYDLTDEQADIWRGVVDGLPAGWIEPGAFAVLAAYCRQTTALRRLGALVRQAEHEGAFDEARLLALYRAHGAAAQVLKTLATSLRLTPQSRMRADAAGARAGDGPKGPRPWEPAADT